MASCACGCLSACVGGLRGAESFPAMDSSTKFSPSFPRYVLKSRCPCPCSLSCLQLGVSGAGERPEQSPHASTKLAVSWAQQRELAPQHCIQASAPEVILPACDALDPPCDRPPAAPGSGAVGRLAATLADDRVWLNSQGRGFTTDAHPRGLLLGCDLP